MILKYLLKNLKKIVKSEKIYEEALLNELGARL
jgi:hypothetical protein